LANATILGPDGGTLACRAAGGGSLLAVLRQGGDSPVGRIDDERGALRAELLPVVPPEVVVGALDVGRGGRAGDVPPPGRLTIVLVLLLLPFPLEIGGFLVGEHLLAGQLARPLERRQRPEIPCALKVRLSVRCSWNGLARALRRLAREVCRGRQCQDRTRNDQCTWKNGESAAHHD